MNSPRLKNTAQITSHEDLQDYGRARPHHFAYATFTQSNRNIQMLKVGINYLFNWSSYRY